MSYKIITAIIPQDRQVLLVEELRNHGVPGVSISQIKGYGEYVNTYSRDSLQAFIKVEIFADEAVAEKIAKLVMGRAQTGIEGDGIVAITSVDTLFRIRDQKILG